MDMGTGTATAMALATTTTAPKGRKRKTGRSLILFRRWRRPHEEGGGAMIRPCRRRRRLRRRQRPNKEGGGALIRARHRRRRVRRRQRPHEEGGGAMINNNDPTQGQKAPSALGGSAMVARPTRRQIFAVLPRQVSSGCCCILTRRASEGSASEPALARRKICEI